MEYTGIKFSESSFEKGRYKENSKYKVVNEGF